MFKWKVFNCSPSTSPFFNQHQHCLICLQVNKHSKNSLPGKVYGCRAVSRDIIGKGGKNGQRGAEKNFTYEVVGKNIFGAEVLLGIVEEPDDGRRGFVVQTARILSSPGPFPGDLFVIILMKIWCSTHFHIDVLKQPHQTNNFCRKIAQKYMIQLVDGNGFEKKALRILKGNCSTKLGLLKRCDSERP